MPFRRSLTPGGGPAAVAAVAFVVAVSHMALMALAAPSASQEDGRLWQALQPETSSEAAEQFNLVEAPTRERRYAHYDHDHHHGYRRPYHYDHHHGHHHGYHHGHEAYHGHHDHFNHHHDHDWDYEPIRVEPVPELHHTPVVHGHNGGHWVAAAGHQGEDGYYKPSHHYGRFWPFYSKSPVHWVHPHHKHHRGKRSPHGGHLWGHNGWWLAPDHAGHHSGHHHEDHHQHHHHHHDYSPAHHYGYEHRVYHHPHHVYHDTHHGSSYYGHYRGHLHGQHHGHHYAHHGHHHHEVPHVTHVKDVHKTHVRVIPHYHETHDYATKTIKHRGAESHTETHEHVDHGHHHKGW